MTTHQPITGQMLPALPAVPPDADLLQRFLEPLEDVHARAYALGARDMTERVTAAAERLEHDCRTNAAAAARALAEEDFAAVSAHAERVAIAGSAAEMIRRVLTGGL